MKKQGKGDASLRLLEAKDISIVAEIWLDSNIKAHSFIHADYWKSHFDSIKELFLQSEIYVCENKNGILGFIGLNETHVEGIFVKEDARSQGVGKQLLDYVKSSKKQLRLSVYKKNTRAVEFYLREKFEIVECNIEQSTNETEYLMVWRGK